MTDGRYAEVMGEPDDHPQKRVFWVRHGETAMNKQNLMRGWDNPPLNDEGRADARAVAEALQAIPLDVIICSDLLRAVETADAIRELQPKKIPHHAVGLLRTIDVGQWTGKPLTQIEPKMEALQKTWQTRPDAECPGGESWTSFQNRQVMAWDLILRHPAENICVVAHLRNSVWSLGYALNDMKRPDIPQLDRLTQKPGRFSVFTYSTRQGLKIEDVNTLETD